MKSIIIALLIVTTLADSCTSPAKGFGCLSLVDVVPSKAAEVQKESKEISRPELIHNLETEFPIPLHNIVSGKEYIIKHKEFSNYLGVNEQDNIILSETPYIWKIVSHGNGLYSLQELSSLRYLKAENSVLSMHNVNQGWERWTITKATGDQWCIKNNAFNVFLVADRSKVWLSNHCLDWEKWLIFQKPKVTDNVDQIVDGGKYFIKSRTWGQYIGATKGANLAISTNPTVWTAVEVSSGLFSLQEETRGEYLKMNDDKVMHSTGANSNRERWTFALQSNGYFCMKNNLVGKYARMKYENNQYGTTGESHCADQEHWIFTRPTSSVSNILGGESYFIQSAQYQQYLAVSGSNLVASDEPAIWTTKWYSNPGLFSFKEESTGRFLKMDDQLKIQTNPHDYSWERWNVYRASDDLSWCIRSYSFRNSWARVRKDDTNFTPIRAGHCQTEEKFRFIHLVEANQVYSGRQYIIKNKQWNRYLAANGGKSVHASLTPMRWTIVEESREVFSLREEVNQNYLKGENDKISTTNVNLGWERWILKKNSDGSFCIQNNEFRTYYAMMDQSYNVRGSTNCDYWEHWDLYQIEDYVQEEIVEAQSSTVGQLVPAVMELAITSAKNVAANSFPILQSGMCFGEFSGSEITGARPGNLLADHGCSNVPLDSDDKYMVMSVGISTVLLSKLCPAVYPPGGDHAIASFCAVYGSCRGGPTMGMILSGPLIACVAGNPMLASATKGASLAFGLAAKSFLSFIGLGFSLGSDFEAGFEIYDGNQIRTVTIEANYFDYVEIGLDGIFSKLKTPPFLSFSGHQTRIAKVDQMFNDPSQLDFIPEVAIGINANVQVTILLSELTKGALPDTAGMKLGSFSGLFTTLKTGGNDLPDRGFYVTLTQDDLVTQLVQEFFNYVIDNFGGIFEAFGIDLNELSQAIPLGGMDTQLGFSVTEEFFGFYLKLPFPDFFKEIFGSNFSFSCKVVISSGKISCNLSLKFDRIFTILKEGAVYVVKKVSQLLDEGGEIIGAIAEDALHETGKWTQNAMEDTVEWIENGALAVGNEIKNALKDKKFLCGAETIVNGAKCGTAVVEDIAKCGFNWVTDGAKCGWNIIEGGINCVGSLFSGNGCKSPKSCKSPKRCEVELECQIGKTCTKNNNDNANNHSNNNNNDGGWILTMLSEETAWIEIPSEETAIYTQGNLKL